MSQQVTNVKIDKSEEFPVLFKEVEMADTYGFLPSAEDIDDEEGKLSGHVPKSNHINKNQKKLNARIEKWRQMLTNIDDMITRKDSLLKKRVRKGIPDGLRTKIWPKLAEIQKFQISDNFSYKHYLEMKSQFEDVIMMDIDRTYPNHIFFKNNQSIGQKSLFNVLKALSTCFPEMGYCQGLNFIIGMFLIYLNDEVALFNQRKLLDGIFNYDEVQILRPLYKSKKCGNTVIRLREISEQIFTKDSFETQLQIISALYASNWFLTLYIYSLCFKTCLRITDIFLLEGEAALIKIALSIMKSKEKVLQKCQGLTQAIPLLKNIKKNEFEDDTLIKNSEKFKISASDYEKTVKEFIDSNKPSALDIELKKKSSRKFDKHESIPDENQPKLANNTVSTPKRMVDYMHFQN